MSRAARFIIAALLGVGVCSAMAAAQAPPDPSNIRPVFRLKAEARPDEATFEADTDNILDVLANDVGVPSDGERPRVTIVPIDADMCGEAKSVEGGVSYRGWPRCIGKTAQFGYKVKLYNAQSGKEEEVYTTVTIKVVARRMNCDVTNSAGRFIKIEGGTFDKAAAPQAIADIVALAGGQSFSVGSFCITLEPVGADEFSRVIASVSDEKKRSVAPELNAEPVRSDSAAATGISHRMASLYMETYKSGGGQAVTLPTINEIVATAWELQARRPDEPETRQFLIGLRSGSLVWTSSPCDTGPGKYFMVGPERQGLGQPDVLGKLCYAQERRYRASFRLVVRQM